MKLAEKYNALLADREAIVRTIRFLPVRLLSGIVADMQAIVGDSPRFEPEKD